MDQLQDKLTTAADAVAPIESGMRVFVGSGCAEPQTLVRALAARQDLRDVEVVHLLTLGIADYVGPEYEGRFRHNAFFIGANVRKAVAEGRADYTPIFLSELPDLIRTGRRVDAALVQVSPPDKHGYCSLGIHVDIQRAAIESASVVIAEINPHMPRTHGNSVIALSRIDHVVSVTEPLLELPPPVLDPVSSEIGAHVARLVSPGSCLQLGIGAIPDAALRFLGDKGDLGIHSEMISDGVVGLVEAGNINNSRKRVHPGKTVISFAMGTRVLYDFLDDNPSVEVLTSDFVNDPRVVAQNDDVIALNSALEVDLTGQVCADSIGYRFYSGIGGQVDFIRGAAMSRGGKPIIAMPSLAKGGTVSRIVPRLAEGAGVVTSRGDVHWVVTEYGAAYLHGKTMRERALALTQIAHPDARQELLDFTRNRHYVHLSPQAWNAVAHPYPTEWETVEEFAEEEFVVRPVRLTDERSLQEFFYGHDPETIYNRYFTIKKELGHEEASHLCSLDYKERMAFGIFDKAAPGRFVAIGRYDLDPLSGMITTAVVVGEDYRRLGMGRYLVSRLVEYAKEQGFRGLAAQILPGNRAMVRLHRELGHDVTWDRRGRMYRVRADWGPAHGKETDVPEESVAPA